MKNVFVSIINYNGNKNTKECLHSIEKLNLKDIRLTVIVIDNNSKIPFEIPDSYSKSIAIKVIRSNSNLGFSGGHNLAIKYALEQNADYVFVLNNDTTLEKDSLTYLLSPFETSNNIGITVPKIYFSKGHEFHKDRYKENELGYVIWYAGGGINWQTIFGMHRGVDEVDNGQYDTQEKTETATGCAMLIKKEVFNKIGNFNEKYFLYYEDQDFSLRATQVGFSIVYVPKAIVWHLNASSTGGSGSELQDYFISRNRMYFGFVYGSIKIKYALFKESMRLLLSGRKSQKNGIRDFYLGRFKKGSFLLD